MSFVVFNKSNNNLPFTLHQKMYARKIYKSVSRNSARNDIFRLRHKLNTENEKKAPQSAPDVLKYLDSFPEYCTLKDQLPKSLLRKYKTPENMYLINKSTAEEIVTVMKKYIEKDCPIVEVNPGLGFMTRELLKQLPNHIYLYEMLNHFSPHLNQLKSAHPNRITYRVADFFGMWKLAFKDKLDQGNRIKELLGDLATDSNDRVVKIVGSMPGLSFVKHMINNIIFHNTTSQLGRPDLFITMPGYHYEFLTDNEIQINKHKSIPALFQMLFDYKILTNVPKVHFLPWTYHQTGKRVTMMDEHRLYLVNITQKEKLPCPPEYLPLLWYFFKPHMLTKTTKIIPMLEQWIPGCGVWLISGQDPPDINKEIAPNEDDAELPHMTIFTEFGDLNLRQKITVFKKFVSLPEFEQCPFKVTMESNLPKFVVPLDDDDKDSMVTHIDDMDNSDVETES
ncbi:dimethyladenosine transferase 2, mitochondrial [Plodia interpunctella]|uniref:dimethyladenosine transferase 2, mitochondrial n=1 Tax=Plodia interpunctella TaxID=58824 RepID=UPI0023685A8D|nr:dimethyladenosine transferase 2, mitochondrial [Plodia interpunctella]